MLVFRTAAHAGQIFIPHRPPAAICAKPASRPRKMRLSREPAEKNNRLGRREKFGLITEKSITVFNICKLFASTIFAVPCRRSYVFFVFMYMCKTAVRFTGLQ